jgi:methylenetetrahydrofolate dehydrogenase (NADP+)/methenyltetrahydrofolate cyclohydrolase
MFEGNAYLVPGLDLGIIELIKSSQVTLENKKCTIICNSPLFGESLKQNLLEYKIKTEVSNAEEYIKNTELQKADIIIIAIGRAQWLKKEIIKKDAIIIDVGINKVEGKILGDVNALDVKDKAGFLSPVPGGVGPMTVAMLLENTFNLALKQEGEILK